VGVFALTPAGKNPLPALLGKMQHLANLLNAADGDRKSPYMGMKNAPAPKGWRGFCVPAQRAHSKNPDKGQTE
jgi:hypothetical protein